ncbi:trk system potassium uptake protein TrkH [Selenomonas ruminantium]|uniref:Trk system potassium uptake protein TrkH n=1 Tax=Selenomonas ruminantium TaxID=971 RepID=A0A1M6S4V7_SELRU|nr:potassium transporter TrkG [Selenomonas ruminantium]SHK39874.1 trk system potassium uptake protein TrkH [Selenomonas ruminantium]
MGIQKANGWELFWLLMGQMSIVMAGALAVPFTAALIWQDTEAWLFVLPAVFAYVLGKKMIEFGASEERGRQLTMKEGVFFMSFVWIFMGLIGLMPYAISGLFPSFAAAFFEAVSSLTTTGLSCLPFDRIGLPRALLLWHGIMSWLGGLTFVVIMVTVLPQVSGCFGLTLSARQSIFFSPVWNKMAQSARQGTTVYAVLTLLSALVYYLAGLNPFESLLRAMVTISSSGGTSAYAFIYYDNPALELAAFTTMLISSLSLLLLWRAWKMKQPLLLWADTEIRHFLLVVLASGALLGGHLYYQGVYDFVESMRYGYFQAMSFISTNGFVAAPFWLWPSFDHYVLFLLVFVGGCIGSATGGLKIMRLLVLLRLSWAELRRTLHPRMVISLKIDGLPVPDKIVGRILSFFFLYMLVYAIFALLLSLSGISIVQALGLASGCLTSTGASAAIFGVDSLHILPDWAKLVCSLLMVIGRVEIFSFLVLLDMGRRSLQKRW